MTFRAGTVSSIALLGLSCLAQNQASAGLIGAGKTVQAFYYNGVFADPEGEINVATDSSVPASLAAAVNFQEGAADLSAISVGDSQIAITNLDSGFPFCLADTPGSACTDTIDGFDFLFTGEDILGVSVDAASAGDFAPVAATFGGNTHLGLQLISPDEIRVDVTGDAPALNDELLIDVSFTSPPPPSVPEPATLPLLAVALSGLGLLTRRMAGRRE